MEWEVNTCLYTVHQHPPCSETTIQEGEAANHADALLTKQVRGAKTTISKDNLQTPGTAFLSTKSSLSHLRWHDLTTRTKVAMQCVRLDIKYEGQRMQRTSIRNECIQLYFRLDWACGRTCKVEKGHGPLHRPAFPRGNKSSCGRPGACQSKAI